MKRVAFVFAIAASVTSAAAEDKRPTFTINGTLPACDEASRGAVVRVSNAGGPITYRGEIQGTGAAFALLLCDGSRWIYH